MNGGRARGRMAVRLCSMLVPLVIALPGAGAYAAPKTDVILLFNGDRITGEVKELAQGKLTFKTDNAGTISIEWDKVVGVQTNQRLEVKLSSGKLYFGNAPQFGPAGMLRLDDGPGSEPREIPITDVVALYSIDQGNLIARLDGYLTAGYSYNKSNALQEFNFTGGINGAFERRRWSLDGSTTFTAQSGRENTQRADLAGVYRWELDHRWFWQALFTAERNDELGLDARETAGGGFGRYLVQTNHHEWAAYAALAGTTEKPTGEPQKQALVGVLGTQYTFFQYDTPQRTVSAKLEAIPGITESNRVRGDAAIESRWEIVKDFIFAVSITAAYDSSPGADAKSHTDYGVVTSLGFTF